MICIKASLEADVCGVRNVQTPNTNKGISVRDESLKVWSYWPFASGDTQRGQLQMGDHFRWNITFDVATASYIRTLSRSNVQSLKAEL